MPANIVYEPADRPEVEILRDGEWLYGDLHAWLDRDGEQWATVSWHHNGETHIETVPENQVRKWGLRDVHYRMLDFERDNTHWTHGGTKATAILEQFGWSEVRYYSILNWVIGETEALEYAPGTVWRLERLRDARREARGFRWRVKWPG